MQTYTQLPQLYQAPAGVINPLIPWPGKGFRAAPTPPPQSNAPTAFFWPRTVDLIDSSSGGRVTIADTGWIAGDFRSLQFRAQDKNTASPLLTDYWNIWLAESDEDMLSAPGSSMTAGMQYNATTGLYTSIDADAGCTNIKTATGAAAPGGTNITGFLAGGTGTPRGIRIGNTGTANSLSVQIGAIVIDVLAPGVPSQFYNIDPNQVAPIIVSSVGTTYGAIAYYGP